MDLALPTALVEESLCPDHVVALAHDDGATELLLYSGVHDAGYIFLKRVLLRPEHADGVIAKPSTPEPTLGAGAETEPVLSVCECGALTMPSGWCANGHAPSDERVVARAAAGG